MNKLRLLFCLLFSPMLANCAVTLDRQQHVRPINAKLPAALVQRANVRSAYFIPKNPQGIFCSEPAPDVAVSQVADITGKLNAKTPKGDEISAETAAKLSLAAAELGGRSQLVLLTRDMLYSICELSAQGLIDKDKASSLFQQVGEVAVKLGQSQVAREQRLAVEAAKVDAAAQAMFDEYRATESRAIVAIMVNLSESGVFSTARLEKMKSILQTDDFRDLAPLRSDIAAISSQDDLKTKLTLDFQDYLDDFLRASQLAATAKS